MGEPAKTATHEQAQLDRIEAMLREVLRTQSTRKRASRKRQGTVADRLATEVVHKPTELQRALVRRRLRSA